MKTKTMAMQLAILSAAGVVAGCSGGSGGGNDIGGPAVAPAIANGKLTLRLIDAPITNVSEIVLEIDMIRLKPADDGPALEFDFDPDRQVDLLSLTADNSELLLDGATVPAGHYDWAELVANATFDGINDSYVTESNTGGQLEVELQVPSGSTRLVSGFTVTADQETSFLIDWNMRMGLVKPPGRPGYMLRPAFRVIDMTAYGSLSGMVAMDLISPATDENRCNDDSMELNPDVGNVVYVFADHGAVPEDIGNLDDDDNPTPEPVATIDVQQDESGDYRYSTILTPGNYTAAFTCQAGLDDPETDDDILFSDPVDIIIVADEDTIQDF